MAESSRTNSPPLISVIDDDESMREALQSLLRSVGFRTTVFASAEDFLTSGRFSESDCLILDVRMPGMSGLELQQKLAAENRRIPTIFISAHSETDEKKRALDAGAIDFLYKPFSEESLLDAVDSALRSGTR
ncbi:MAG: response regulator [Acidobacteria bacterium]|nr:response regulator [Acidobacteriota bacterium]